MEGREEGWRSLFSSSLRIVSQNFVANCRYLSKANGRLMADWLKGFLNVSEDASSCFIFVFISPENINFGLVSWSRLTCHLPLALG